MKVIFTPGFWDSAEKFSLLSEIFSSHNIDCKVLDYKKYRGFGNTLNDEVFAKILDELKEDDFKDTILIAYSMGGSFLYDYFKNHDFKPAKIIFVNPLIENVGNSFTSSYYRVLDMYKQNQLFDAIKTAHKMLFPLIDIAYLQQNYNKKINFDKKLELDATFVWSEKDLICPITKYEKYKELFQKTALVSVPNHHHNWLLYKEPIEEYLLPQISQ